MSAALSLALAVWAAGHFLAPAEWLPGRSALPLPLRALATALGRAALALALLLSPIVGASPGSALALSAGVAALSLASEGASALLAAIAGGGERGARGAIALAAALAATGPLWLGPLLADDAAPAWLREEARNAVIAASPVCALAALVGEDLLRSEAAYRSTPLARVRYAYPRPVAALAGWLLVGTLAFVVRRSVRPDPRDRPTLQEETP